jgi:predicted RecA/RadA family phage recombinase
MKNDVQNGHIIEYSNSGSAISSGAVVVLDQRIGIAITDIAASTGKGSVQLDGVFQLTSDTGTAYAQGDRLFWDVGNSRLTKTGTGNIPAGVCVLAKESATAVARVRLSDHPKQAAKVADASSGSAAEINALRDALIAAGYMKNA